MATQTTVNVQKGCEAEVSDLYFSGLSHARTPVTLAYTVLLTDYLIAYTALAAARVVTLPAAASCAGRVFIVKDESGAAGANNITIDPAGAELIDGAATKVINANYGSARFYSNGTAWFTF